MRRRSSSSVRIKLFRLDYEEVMGRLKEYADRAIAKGALAVILVGSLARGDYTAFSDADVVVVVSDEAGLCFAERVKEFMDPTLPIDLEPRVYTVKELLEMAMEGRGVVKEVAEYGKLLAGKAELVDKVKALVKGRFKA